MVEDAGDDPRTCDTPALVDLQVIGYAGMTLTTEGGLILGSLCAIDTEPRKWTPDELRLLADLAASCVVALRLRIAAERPGWR